MGSRILAVFASVMMPVVFNANAAVVYSYTGNNFTSADAPYTTDMNITLEFVTAEPLASTGAMTDVTPAILSYTLFDGRKTLTEVDSESFFVVNMDAVTGLPMEWSISVTNEFGKTVGDIINRMNMFYSVFSGGIDRAEEGECRVFSAGTGECMGLTNVIFAEVFSAPGASGSWRVVPVPEAIWLFGSGIAGLFAVSRRKREAS